MYSLVIPVYKNSASIPELLLALSKLNQKLKNQLECVFVIDASPENEQEILKRKLPKCKFKSQLIVHSKNFGSFSAIRTGFEHARGEYYTYMAADLQESTTLIEKIFSKLQNGSVDIVVAKRTGRQDAALDSFFSNIFWTFYRRFINPDIPVGGIDLFGCNQKVKDTLLSLRESHTSLVALLYWSGFKKDYVNYQRHKRKYGKSTWTFIKKMDYALDSVYSFSKLPIKILEIIGIIGLISTLSYFYHHNLNYLLITLFGSLNLLALSIVCQYLWRIYENSKNRPNSVITEKFKYH